jgi:hypothetical protein
MAVGLTVEIRGDTSKLDSALDSSSGKVGGFSAGIGKSALAIGAVAGVVGVAATAVVGLTNAAADDAAEQAKLEATIRAAGAATAESTAQVEAAIVAGQERAFTDSETRAGLESLIVATGDVGTATALLTQAQDIARFAGVDLATASDAVAKAHAGQDGALRKLVPGLAKGATAADTIAAASKAAAGQADLYAESAAGMGAKGADAFAEIGETIGGAFLPVLAELLPALLPILKVLGELVTALLPLLIPLVKLLAGALRIVIGVLSIVVGWLVKLVTWIGTAISSVQSFLEAANPFSNFRLPELPFGIGNAAGSSSAAGRAGGGGAAAAPLTVNVYGAIDPEGVARSVARVLNAHAIRTGRAPNLGAGTSR